MAKGPHKAGQLPRTVTKPFGLITSDQACDEERPMPTESTLIGSEYTSTRSRYGSAYHPREAVHSLHH
nr:MAG TPA_asm: hypothetical protein [Caudoviricetes sp.]DAN96440.1 MAG TPA: hypothetical protein [Caudoviricetes sp.]